MALRWEVPTITALDAQPAGGAGDRCSGVMGHAPERQRGEAPACLK